MIKGFHTDKSILIILLCSILLGACAKNTTKTAASTVQEITEINQPEILMVQFKYYSNDSLRITDLRRVNGRFREKKDSLMFYPGDLKVEFSDQSGAIQKQILVNNPLQPRLESFAEDGKIQGVELSLDSTDIFIRVNDRESFRELSVYKTSENATFKLLLKTDL